MTFPLCVFRTNKAVRCVLERGDDMLITGARHPVLAKYKVTDPANTVRRAFGCEACFRIYDRLFQVGFMKDGRIMAADIQFFTNAGNTVDESVLVGLTRGDTR